MLEIALYILSVAYITRCLLLSNETGPMPHASIMVVFESNGQKFTRSANLFDFIRRVFGLYKITGLVWTQKDRELWHCPYCLSFWINVFLAIPFLLAFGLPLQLAALLLFAVPMAVGKINEYPSSED